MAGMMMSCVVTNGLRVPGGTIITAGVWQYGDTDNTPVPRDNGGALRPYL